MKLPLVAAALLSGLTVGLHAVEPPKPAPISNAKPPLAKDILADAIVWQMAGLTSTDGAIPLTINGAAKVGVELSGPEREASLSRGGDGKVAEFDGGFLVSNATSRDRLNLKGEAMTMLLRLRSRSGEWKNSEIFAKHGGHNRLLYNLYINGNRLGFEFGAEGRPGLAAQAAISTADVKPGEWHDLVAVYDGSNLVLWHNGIVAARTPAKGALRQGNTEPVSIGKALRGQVDHAALWNRALSEKEIVALSGGEASLKAKRETLAKTIEAKIGREGLTLADQLRGARELRERLWSDPHRPRYHLLPPDGFWNDINGTIYWKGRYHVFFLGRQAPNLPTILSGKDTDHARETWLHASSRDLVHWIHHPPALVPTFDGSMPRGIYSGDMMDDMPTPTIIVHVPGQGTCLYTAEDDELNVWKPHPKNPVIPSAGAPSEAIIFDPTGWKDGDTYYALVGNKNKRPGFEGDSSSLFRSKDLENWEYRGPFYKSDRRWTEEYEDCACPDFFPLGNKHMLISHVHRPWNHLQYYIGLYDKQAEKFLPEQHGYMSWPGGQICAPETLLDGNGRRIFWGWISEARPNKNGWGSVTSLPRVLSLADDSTLRIEPAPELETLRFNPRKRENLIVSADNELNLDDIRGDSLELSLVIEPGDAKELGIKVRCSPDGAEQTPIIYTPQAKTLKTELAKSTFDPEVRYSWANAEWAKDHGVSEEKRFAKEQVAPFELKAGEPLRLRIFIDRSVLEIYANERQCITQRIYPSRADSLGVSLFTRGGSMKVRSLEAWEMSPTNSW